MSFRSSFSGIALVVLAASLVRGQSPVFDDYQRAAQLVGQRYPDPAISILESIIAKAPRFYRAYAELADAFNYRHASEQAEVYFHGLLEDPERSAFAHYGLARNAELAHRWEDATDHYTACVRQMPDSVPCYAPLAKSIFRIRNRAATTQDLLSRVPSGQSKDFSCLARTELLILQRRLGDAAQSAQGCLTSAEALGDADFLSAAHDLKADAYEATGADWATALQEHMTVIQLAEGIGDPDTAVLHQSRVCQAYTYLNRYTDAEECFEKLMDASRVAGNLDWKLVALSGAQVYKRLGQFERAIAEISEAFEIQEKNGDFEGAAGSLVEIANIHFLQGDLPLGRQTCERAIQLAREHGIRHQEAYALRELSRIYAATGDPILALRYANESITIFRQVGMNHQAGAGIGNLPEIYGYMGDWSTALRYARESFASARRNQDVVEQQDVLAIIGEVHLGMEQYGEAAHDFQQALAMGSETQFAPFRLMGLMGLGRALLGKKDHVRAEACLREALELARKSGDRRTEADALAQLGRCYRQFGLLEKAREHFELALEIAAKIPLLETTLAARRGLADMAAAAGNFHQALAHLVSATADIESLRARIPTADLKASFGRENAKLFENLLYVLAQLDRREPGVGWDRKAFDYAERGRARVLLDLMAEARAQVNDGLTAEQRQQRRQLDAALSSTLSALLQHDSAANRQATSRAERNLADWITAIRVTDPQYEVLTHPATSDTAHAVALAAEFDGTILEYALGDRESYLWIVTQRGVRFVHLPPRAVVERLVAEYRKLITRRPLGAQFDAWQRPAAALYDMLVRPAQGYLTPQRPLMIVPDGILHYLPFETLRVAGTGGRPQCMVEVFPISYLPSVSVAAELLRRGPERAHRFDLLAYGDPIFARTGKATANSDLVRGVYESAGIRFAQLPNTRREVEIIGRLFPSDRRSIFLGADATEVSVKRADLPDYRLLHFATHAVVDERNPARSGIVLSLWNTGDEDGILRMNEIYRLKLDADLVVLSACQTGLGSLVRGEGMVGLTRAFFYAGARRLAVTLWDVNDLIAPDFMESFYRHLRQGDAPASALRSAKIEMLHSDSPARANPYSWAPYVLQAAPEIRKNK